MGVCPYGDKIYINLSNNLSSFGLYNCITFKLSFKKFLISNFVNDSRWLLSTQLTLQNLAYASNFLSNSLTSFNARIRFDDFDADIGSKIGLDLVFLAITVLFASLLNGSLDFFLSPLLLFPS